MTKYKEVKVDPWAVETLPADVKQQLLQNIEVCRDAVVFFTACGSASGYGGHTGGAFDTVRNFVLRPAVFSVSLHHDADAQACADARGDASPRLLQRQVWPCASPICVPGARGLACRSSAHGLQRHDAKRGCACVLRLFLLCRRSRVLAVQSFCTHSYRQECIIHDVCQCTPGAVLVAGGAHTTRSLAVSTT